MTGIVAKPCKATLPNCDQCGRFTSTPTEHAWCEAGDGAHLCFSLLLCPRCEVARGTTEGDTDHE